MNEPNSRRYAAALAEEQRRKYNIPETETDEKEDTEDSEIGLDTSGLSTGAAADTGLSVDHRVVQELDGTGTAIGPSLEDEEDD